jgi:hypothetical protein
MPTARMSFSLSHGGNVLVVLVLLVELVRLRVMTLKTSFCLLIYTAIEASVHRVL